MATLASLAVLGVVRIGAFDRLRAWGRVAAPTPSLHAALSRLQEDDLSNLRETLPLNSHRHL